MASATEMGRQVRWMMALRVIIVTSLFLPTAMLLMEELSGERSGSAFGLDVTFLAYLMGLTYGLTLVYVVLLRRATDLGRFAFLQIAIDVLLETGIVYYSGAVTTPFLVLYLVSVMAASILLDRRGALGIASFAVLAYLSLLNLVYYGVLPFRSPVYQNVASIPRDEVLYHVFVTLTGFFATAVLVNYLAERNRKARQQLREVGHELTELQQFNERVINNISGGLLVITADARVSLLNTPGSAISGYSPAEVRGRPLSLLLPRALEVLAAARQALQSRKVYRFEDELAARDGRAIPVGASLTELTAADGRGAVGYILIFQDLTELRKLESEVRVKERLAAVGELAAGIAHEIRNPLASMSGSVQLLKQELHLSGDQQRLMDIVVDESRRLSRIIQDFLTFVRPPTPRLEMTHLGELLSQTVLLLQHGEECGAGHEIVLRGADGNVSCLVDPSQMKQVFWNLALNALGAMPHGGKLHIELDGGAEIRIVFRDEGVGMSHERLATLFTPFAAGRPGRSGLGLSIVYGILREHGGSIAAESEPGKGTTMTLVLPRRVAVPQVPVAAVAP